MSPATAMPRLASHVRACRVGDQLIFLDLLRSKYIGVGGPGLAAFAAALLDDTSADGTSWLALPSHWIHRLRAHDLLADVRRSPGECATSRSIEPVRSLQPDDNDDSSVDWRHLGRLWRATLVTTAWIRRRSLADIADRVAALRLRHAKRRRTSTADAMAAAVASYVRLRPLALTTHDRCLHDSLTLINFLAPLGLFPNWVIGVRVHPFAAHSWVQDDDVVLNDLAERVRHYRPILSV